MFSTKAIVGGLVSIAVAAALGFVGNTYLAQRQQVQSRTEQLFDEWRAPAMIDAREEAQATLLDQASSIRTASRDRAVIAVARYFASVHHLAESGEIDKQHLARLMAEELPFWREQIARLHGSPVYVCGQWHTVRQAAQGINDLGGEILVQSDRPQCAPPAAPG
jgi:hypothetical protein